MTKPIYLLIALFYSLVCANGPELFQQVGYCCTGFGVPGNGTPVIAGKTLVIPPGEGYETVIDVSNPKNPRIARYIPSWYFTSGIYDVPSCNIAYLTNSRGPMLYLDDLKDVAQKGDVKEAAWNPAWGKSFISGIAPDGIGYTVVADSIVVIDFKDPEHLKELARIAQPRLRSSVNPKCYLLSFSADYKLSTMMLDSCNRIGIFKWGNHFSPVLESEIDNRDSSVNKIPSYGLINALDRKWLVISHTIFQSVNRTMKKYRELSFWNISNVSKPRLVCKKVLYEPGTILRGLAVSGSYCYAIDGRATQGQHTVIPSQHSRICLLDLTKFEKDTSKANNDTLKLSPKTTLLYEDTLVTEYSNVRIDKNIMYVNDYNYGLWIFDISNPHSIVKLSGLPTSAEGRWLYVSANYAYMSHTFGAAFHIINIKDPNHPKTEGYFWDGHWMNYRAKLNGRGNAMYLPENDRLITVDIGNPTHPKQACELLNNDNQHITGSCIDISGNTLFVIENPRGKIPAQFLSFDITDPLKPTLEGSLDLPEKKGFHITVSGDKAYCVANGGKHIVAVDISDRKSPSISADFSAPEISIQGKTYPFTIKDGGGNGSPGLAFFGGYLYVVTGNQSQVDPDMFVFDVKDPTSIKPVSAFYSSKNSGWQYFSCDVMFHDNRMYFENYGSESVYDMNDPLDPKIIAEYQRAYAWELGSIRDGLLYVPKLDGLEILRIPQ
jgi:hypothetical protein